MDSLRKVEEDLRNIAVEFRKKYPEVIEATERALATLKTMREMYVADKMRKSGMEKEVVKIPQSSDILAPYILACNYADANHKLLILALSGIQLLVSYQMVPPVDVKNLLRVFSIQASSGKSEIQLKILQVLLYMANYLSTSESLVHYLNEATLRGFFTLTLSMCDSKCAVSVSTTAQATIRQLISIILDPLRPSLTLSSISSIEVKSNYTNCALCLMSDIVLCIQSNPGEWCKSVQVPQSTAFDLLDYILCNWKDIIVDVVPFKDFMKNVVFSALKPLLRGLQEDFTKAVLKDGVTIASAQSSRVIRLARFFLLNLCVQEFLDEIDTIITIMVHALTSEYDFEGLGNSPRSSQHSTDDDKDFTEAAGSSMMGGASALFGGLARFQFGSKEKSSTPTGSAALQMSYLTLKKSTSGGSFLTSEISQSSGKPASRLLAHPAGVCLEALFAFFLSDLAKFFSLADGRGRSVLASAMVNVTISATSVVTQAMLIESNVKAFAEAVQESKIVTALEGILSNKDSDTTLVLRSIHDSTMSSATISSADTLILAFSIVQVIVRHLAEFSLESADYASLTASSYFLDELKSARRWKSTDVSVTMALKDLAKKVSESVYENIEEAYTASLANVRYPIIVRRSIGVLAETALVTGLLNLTRPCEVLVAALCRFTVPRWHGLDTISIDASFNKDPRERISDVLKWEHIQAIVRLTQTVHVLGNRISDWDIVVDAFEQITDYLLNPKILLADDVTSTEVDKVFVALERFKGYTVFLSDQSLVKLMTSLVALSLNNLAVTAKSLSSGDSIDNLNGRLIDNMPSSVIVKNKPRRAPAYMIEGIVAGYVSFSLQTAVEIAKFNMHRISCIWQMVASHLKMVASLKSSGVRSVAVAATYDLITNALKHLHTPSMHGPEVADNKTKAHVKVDETMRGPCLSDDVLYNNVVPSFESVFLARKFHLTMLSSQVALRSVSPELSQGDLLSCLKILSAIRYDDVKVGIMQGLLTLLQGDCEELSEDGWRFVIALIAEVPASLTDADDADNDVDQKWPVTALDCAFNCMKLILDEYLESVSLVATTSIISALSSFSSQVLDVNISLTSLEMLWKVYDQTMRLSSGQGAAAQAVFDVTMKQLLVLSMDMRPEIRHCAMNTLFAALTMTANATLTNGAQWKQIFDDVVFPLFVRAGQRSHQAMQLNEEAIAPELKKGQKMVLHHSRDTAHKQWSETRVLALRGLVRVVKTCAILLIQEKWFKSTWATALEVCKKTTQAAAVDQEVAVASFDVMFAMLKMVSETNFKILINNHSKEILENGIELYRKDLWQSTWNAVTDASKYSGHCSELALHISQSMMAIYEAGASHEFSQLQNLKDICDAIVTLARPRIKSDNDAVLSPSNKNKVTELQHYRLLLEFLKLLKVSDVKSATLIASTLTELCFANQHVFMLSPINGENIQMGPCPLKFREEVGEFFMSVFLPMTSKIPDDACGISIVDTVFRRFISDMCGTAISKRSEVLHIDTATTPQKNPIISSKSGSPPNTTSKNQLSFFSFLTGSIATDEEDVNCVEEDDDERGQRSSEEPRTPTKIDPSFHALKQCSVPDKDQSHSWSTFYPLSVELKVLCKTLKDCITSVNFVNISEPTRENIFSSFLCLVSPWRMQELPGAKASHGSFVEAFRSMFELQMCLLNILDDLAMAHDKSNWTVALVSTLADALKLQIQAIAESDQSHANNPEEIAGIINLWKRSSEILNNVATNSHGLHSKQAAITTLLAVTKDFSYAVLDKKKCKYTKSLFEEGCILFLRSLLQLETQMIDMPKTFSVRKSSEKEILNSWLGNLTNTPIEVISEKVSARKHQDKNDGFSKAGHLFIFLPIAFQLHQCDREEIKDIVTIITSSVDIAALIKSYTELQTQIERIDILNDPSSK